MVAELKIHRTAVTQNRKCESCLHYDGNAAAKAGACEVGTQPFMCGDGSTPRLGYAPLAEMTPDMMDDVVTSVRAGSSTLGLMNEHGNMEFAPPMQKMVLGDEELSIAQKIKGEASAMRKGHIAPVQGQTGMSCPDVYDYPYGSDEPATFDIVKSLYTDHLRPAFQHRYSLKEVLFWLGENGYDVTDDDTQKADDYDEVNREVLKRQHKNQERERGVGA